MYSFSYMAFLMSGVTCLSNTYEAKSLVSQLVYSSWCFQHIQSLNPSFPIITIKLLKNNNNIHGQFILYINCYIVSLIRYFQTSFMLNFVSFLIIILKLNIVFYTFSHSFFFCIEFQPYIYIQRIHHCVTLVFGQDFSNKIKSTIKMCA